MKKLFLNFVQSICFLAVMSVMPLSTAFAAPATVDNAITVKAEVPVGFVRPLVMNLMSEEGEYKVEIVATEDFTKTVPLPEGIYDVTNVTALNDSKGTYRINCDNYLFTVSASQTEPIAIKLTVKEQGDLFAPAEDEDPADTVITEPTEDDTVENVEPTEPVTHDSQEDVPDEPNSDAEADEIEPEQEDEGKLSPFVIRTIFTGAIFVVLGIVWIIHKKFFE